MVSICLVIQSIPLGERVIGGTVKRKKQSVFSSIKELGFIVFVVKK